MLLMILAMVFAVGAFGRRFRAYTFATLAALVAFGALTSVQAPRVAAGLPTPWIGVWERLMLAAFLAWVVALAVALLRTIRTMPRAHAG
jgi:ABC-type transport system involved in cytochrome c biogenesis permease subunit